MISRALARTTPTRSTVWKRKEPSKRRRSLRPDFSSPFLVLLGFLEGFAGSPGKMAHYARPTIFVSGFHLVVFIIAHAPGLLYDTFSPLFFGAWEGRMDG